MNCVINFERCGFINKNLQNAFERKIHGKKSKAATEIRIVKLEDIDKAALEAMSTFTQIPLDDWPNHKKIFITVSMPDGCLYPAFCVIPNPRKGQYFDVWQIHTAIEIEENLAEYAQ